MPTVLLVRHGVTAATGRRAGGRTSASLSPDGRAQAAAVADRLARRRLAAVYASPLPRARETAAAIAERHRLDVLPLAGVLELDHGRWTDVPFGRMARTKLFGYVVSTPSRAALPEGESFVDAQHRAVAAVEEVVARHTDRQTVAVVSHADIIKLLVAHYAGLPLDLFQRLVVSPASLSILGVPRTGPARVIAVNDVGHLERHGGEGS